MKVLVGCEFSGIVRREFSKLGHDAWSCDLMPSEIVGNHLQCDVLEVLNNGWDLAVFHPPCTRIANSGVRWLAERNLWEEMIISAMFFKKLLNAEIKMVAVENPIPHKYALDVIGEKYSQIIQPWQFGHGEVKSTCLWLKGLPPLAATRVVDGRIARVHLEPPSKERWKNRSRTYAGIAEAMAAQWGGLD
jgi:hypothetical protein